MRFSFIISTAAAFSAPAADYKAEFAAFKTKFSKAYASAEEEAMRFAIFVRNLGAAQAENVANAEFATQGVTKFMDLAEHEFKEIYLTRKSSRANATAPTVWDGKCTACVRFPEQSALVEAPPTEFDWTTKGAVTPVKDQGQCGSCWSFGTTGDIEGTYFLAGNDLISLSEEELVQCDTRGEDQGCNGGLQESAFEFVIKNGLTTEAHYPYTSGHGKTGHCVDSKEKPVAATISSWTQVPSRRKNSPSDRTRS
jgi:C1A family cysteine protease